MTNAIELHSVTRAYGGAKALDDVSLAVPEGSILGLLGRNGAGKTTLMSLVAGQDRPSTGSVSVYGDRPFENAVALRKTIFVRDSQRYPDRYRLHHVLRIAPAFAPNWNAEVAAEIVDGLRIPQKTPIKKLSRGQLSAVAIVLGIASRSPITLLDEPYLGLDVTARWFFHDILLRDYAEHPRTIILSTHLIDESEALFDRVVILDRGRICVDAESDVVPELAVILSGPAEAVDRLAASFEVLTSHAVPGLRSVTVKGSATTDLLRAAKAANVQVSRASLQDLVAAFGADAAPSPAETASVEKGARA
jgi:ABC-2 type transport system ATP-binding protein